MKIAVHKISQQGLKLSHDYKPQDLDIDTRDVKFSRDIHAEVFCTRIDKVLTLEVTLNSSFRTLCSCCAEDITRELNKKFTLYIDLEKNQDYVDITSDLREELMLDYPIRILCKKDCKGFCFKCGKNLNEGDCACEKN